MKRNILILFGLFISAYVVAQVKVVTVQPTIMVIPFTKKGQDIRTILEEDFNKRVAITTVKEAFDNEGFTTKDFTAFLKQMMKERAMESDTKTDLKSDIVQQSGADMYVEVEVFVQKSSSGNSVKLILTAYDVSTSQSLSNKVGESGKFYTDDIAKLSQKAVDNCKIEFLKTLNEKFGEIVKNGRSVKINIVFDENSEIDMDSEIGVSGDILADRLEEWMDNNALNNNWHLAEITQYKFRSDDFRIPIKDPKSGRNYRASKTASKLRKFLSNELELEVTNGARLNGQINLVIK